MCSLEMFLLQGLDLLEVVDQHAAHRGLYSKTPLNLCKHSSQEFSRGDFTPHNAAAGLSGKMGHFLGVISCLGFFLAILPRQTGPGRVGRRHICGPGSYMSLLTEHWPVPSRGQGAGKSPSPGTLRGTDCSTRDGWTMVVILRFN